LADPALLSTEGPWVDSISSLARRSSLGSSLGVASYIACSLHRLPQQRNGLLLQPKTGSD